MAKTGIDYFSLDVGFLRDKKIKLIKGEFGAKGILIVIQLLCSIYEEDGYYKVWDEDDCYLMADAVGCGITPELITQVIQGCVRRDLFNKDLFDMFNVLTSHSIQKRYCRAAYKRDIEIFEEYLLLDLSNPNDITEATSKKVTLKSLNTRNSTENSRKSDIDSRISKQSKVKESKVNKSKEEKRVYGAYAHVHLTDNQKDTLIEELGQALFDKCIKRLDEYIQETGKKYEDHNLTIRRWVIKAVKEDLEPKKVVSTNKFNNLGENQRSNDYDSLEIKLLKANRKENSANE